MSDNSHDPAVLFDPSLTVESDDKNGTEAVEFLAHLIDLSDDLGRGDGARRSLVVADRLKTAKLKETDAALLEYFRTNAWWVKKLPEIKLSRRLVEFRSGRSSL
jgi:hypothetical protein